MLQQMKKNKRDSEKLLVIAYLIVDLPFQIFFLDIRKMRINNYLFLCFSIGLQS